MYDVRTGCWYDLHPGMRISTASVIKAGILGAALLRAQDAHRGLTRSEQGLAAAMIEYSHDPQTSALYARIGGPAGMNAFDRRVGARETSASSSFGATVTTARDRTLVALRLLWGGGPLAAPARSVAWRYLASVTPTQRWGITAGVSQVYEVALKNGCYPMRGRGWRVGSTGFVRRHGMSGGYAITIMTDQDSTQSRGIGEVEAVSRWVATALAPGPAAARLVDRAVCTQTSDPEGWVTVARRLGLPASRAGAVAFVSGGNAAPLSGQRACSPYLR